MSWRLCLKLDAIETENGKENCGQEAYWRTLLGAIPARRYGMFLLIFAFLFIAQRKNWLTAGQQRIQPALV